MKARFRIKEITLRDGNVVYIPQEKGLLWGYNDITIATDGFPVYVCTPMYLDRKDCVALIKNLESRTPKYSSVDATEEE